MGTLAIVIILAAVALALYVIYRENRKVTDPEHARAPQSDKFENGKVRDIPLRKASEKINVPPPADAHGHGGAHAHGGVPAPITADGGFVESGSAQDKVGPPLLAKRIDLVKSTQQISPDNKLFKPGDSVLFSARIVDSASKPIEGVPVVWRNDKLKRDLGSPVRTDAQGTATMTYAVQAGDTIGDPASPEADTGSYVIHCYAGGRLLQKNVILHDVN